MIAMLRDLVAHKGYANAAVLATAASSPAARADAGLTDLLHHVLVANRFWALSITGQEFRTQEELASSRAFGALVAGFRDLQRAEETWLARVSDADIAADLAGPLVPGGRCTVAQALVQVCLHSLGHRAQCATLLRRHGLTPPAIDFITWLAARPVAAWPDTTDADMAATHHAVVIHASPDEVYAALLDPALIPEWRVPAGMHCDVHTFDPREGGAFRVSLTYDAPTGAGKTTSRTDTYHGVFEQLIQDQRIVERLEFETADPRMQGEMRIVTELAPQDDGTLVTAVHEGLPPGVAPADNEAGWKDALAKLAALLAPPGGA